VKVVEHSRRFGQEESGRFQERYPEWQQQVRLSRLLPQTPHHTQNIQTTLHGTPNLVAHTLARTRGIGGSDAVDLAHTTPVYFPKFENPKTKVFWPPHDHVYTAPDKPHLIFICKWVLEYHMKWRVKHWQGFRLFMLRRVWFADLVFRFSRRGLWFTQVSRLRLPNSMQRRTRMLMME
jgi:hypothetical protein